jgi:hypothetical protein
VRRRIAASRSIAIGVKWFDRVSLKLSLGISIAGLVTALYTVGVTPADVTALRDRKVGAVGTQVTCPNQACPYAGRRNAGNIRNWGRWRGQMEYFCAECGSRFIGARLIMTFDEGHGTPTILPASVARAQARLRAWRVGSRGDTRL